MQGPRERMVVSAALLIREREPTPPPSRMCCSTAAHRGGRPITTSRAVVPNCYARPSITPESMSPP